jgi:cytochrome c5
MLPLEDFMRDVKPPHDEPESPHEGPIKTAKQLIQAVFFAFVVPIIGIILLASYVATDKKPNAGSDGMSDQAIAQRIRPVAGAPDVKDASDISTLRTGAQVYSQQCAACHAAGTLGSPKFGDVAAWAPRIAQGYEALRKSAINGKGSMGAQGAEGDAVLNFEVSRAVVYMANEVGAKFGEPAAPVAASAPQ